jgi:demethylmenaquinone methyltransferase/2-methoxy-6-polyprenyl-1,4-benzoquinol methylase
MSRVALAEAGGNAKIVMYDPIPEMLANVKNFFGPEVERSLSSGVFEYMPFRDNTFDVVMCGYSMRDSIDLKNAISEMHRVLRPGGRLIIVDLGKPDNPITRFMVAAYLKYFLGISAYLVAGKAGLKFKTLYGTFLRWPQNSQLEAMLLEKFSKVQLEKGMMGGAVMIGAYK